MAVLQVDAGHMFSDQVSPAGYSPETLARNEWVLKGLELLEPAALNVSYRDVGYLATLTGSGGYAASAKRFPALERFVSANVVPIDGSVRPFAPYAIREVAAPRAGDKPLRVGFLGLTELPTGLGASPRSKIDIGGYTLTDPLAAAARYVPELRAKVDVLVVLGYLDRDAAMRLGASVPGIDMILTARGVPTMTRTDDAGDAVVAFASLETKSLAEMRLYRSEGAKAGRIGSFIHRVVYLDSIVPDHPASFRLAAEARAAIEAAAKTPAPSKP